MSGPFGFVRRLTAAVVNVPAKVVGADEIVDFVDHDVAEPVTDVLDAGVKGVTDVLGDIFG